MKIVPALLSTEAADYRAKLALTAGIADFVQIDYMDGDFVPSRSIPLETAAAVDVPLDWEAHLMVSDPLEWARSLPRPRLKRVIFHAEAVRRPAATAEGLRRLGLSPGLALNPPTAVSEVLDVLPLVDVVLIMSVNPGFYGSPFIPEALPKAAEVRLAAPRLVIGIDGGMGPDTIAAAKAAGFDYACVGSRIYMAEDPKASFDRLAAQAR